MGPSRCKPFRRDTGSINVDLSPHAIEAEAAARIVVTAGQVHIERQLLLVFAAAVPSALFSRDFVRGRPRWNP
jgi:hypothetical protein